MKLLIEQELKRIEEKETKILKDIKGMITNRAIIDFNTMYGKMLDLDLLAEERLKIIDRGEYMNNKLGLLKEKLSKV